MKKYIILLFCSVLANAQLINDLSTEWRSNSKNYTYKDERNDSFESLNKGYEGILLSDNFFYRTGHFDLAGNIRWQADGTVPGVIKENLNTYRIYAMNNQKKLYGFTLSGGFERQIANDKGWVRDGRITEVLDTLYNPVDTLFTPEKYENILYPDMNILWSGAGYEFHKDKLSLNPQFYFFSRNIKGIQTVSPVAEVDSLRNVKIDAEDYEWQAKFASRWDHKENLNFQVRAFYSDDLDSINYYNVYYVEAGAGTDLIIRDFKITGYACAGQLRYHETDNLYGRMQLSATYNSHPNLKVKIKNSCDIYQDETYSEKLSLYSAWLFKQAGYDHNQISGYGSINIKGRYRFGRIGGTARHWSGSWLNELDLGVKASEILAMFTATAKSQYYFNKFNSVYIGVEYLNYSEDAFRLGSNDVTLTVGFSSGLY